MALLGVLFWIPFALAQSMPKSSSKPQPSAPALHSIELLHKNDTGDLYAPTALKLAYFEAEAQYQAWNYNVAHSAFQRILDSFSTPQTNQFLLGVYFRLAQLHSMSYSFVDANNEIQPHDPDIIQALQYVKMGLGLQPNHIDLLYLKATLEYNDGCSQQAAQTFMMLCALDPHSFTFHHFAAMALSQTLKRPGGNVQAKDLLDFCDTWETHLGNTEKVRQYRQMANDYLQIQAISAAKNNPNKSWEKPVNENKNTQKSVLSTTNKYRKFLALCLELNRYQEAHIWADSLESVAPIFSAHNLVNAFSHAYNNLWELAQAETANSQVETDPFILNQYLRISARIASHKAQQHPNFGNPKLPETELALNLWIDLHQREGLSPNDLSFAISIADQAHSVQYLTVWKQMAQDLKNPPTQK